MPIHKDYELAMSPPDRPCVVELFLDSYRAGCRQLEEARRDSPGNRRRNASSQALIEGVANKYRGPNLGLQRLQAAEAKARAEHQSHRDDARLAAELKSAEVQWLQDKRDESAERTAALERWQEIYGPSRIAELSAFDEACDALFEAFESAMRQAITQAGERAAKVIADYEASLTVSDGLLPQPDSSSSPTASAAVSTSFASVATAETSAE